MRDCLRKTGSSAPELGTVIIGVFFAKDDIGVSGVIGSAVFNIMFVIAVCALCSGAVCNLNWWPMVRDCFFYSLSIIVMLSVMWNGFIAWVSVIYAPRRRDVQTSCMGVHQR